MSDHRPIQPTPDHLTFANPDASSRGQRVGKAIGWIAVGALGATVLTGVAFASNRTSSGTNASSSASAASSSDRYADGPRGGPGEGRHGGPFGGLLGRGNDVLHGEFVVKAANGKTRTVLTQNGKVTAASSSSLTVASTDGFTATWALGSTTKVHSFASRDQAGKTTDVKVGAQVVVSGPKVTSTSGTADFVAIRPTADQLKALQKNGPMGGMRDGMHPEWANPTPSGTATAAPSGA